MSPTDLPPNNPNGNFPAPRKESLRVSTQLSENDRVLSWFESLYDVHIPKTVWLQCELALAEGFTNAVRHAHNQQPPDLNIDVEINILAEYMEIKIWDQGPSFDLTDWLAKQPPQTDPFAPGGRGVKLMYAIADQLSYTRTDDHRNCLSIVKNYYSEDKKLPNINELSI
ncbi:MAG: ATP-binding protein [Microcoleaceae cyanobacterium]